MKPPHGDLYHLASFTNERVCGRIYQADQEVVSGSYSNAYKYCGTEEGKVTTTWNLRRTPIEIKHDTASEEIKHDTASEPLGGGAALLPADLALTVKHHLELVSVGDKGTYTFTVTNLGDGPAPGTTLAHSLPEDVTYVSATPSQGSCQESGRIVQCNLNELAKEASATVGIVMTLKTVGNLSSMAAVNSYAPDLYLDNNIVTTTGRLQ